MTEIANNNRAEFEYIKYLIEDIRKEQDRTKQERLFKELDINLKNLKKENIDINEVYSENEYTVFYNIFFAPIIVNYNGIGAIDINPIDFDIITKFIDNGINLNNSMINGRDFSIERFACEFIPAFNEKQNRNEQDKIREQFNDFFNYIIDYNKKETDNQLSQSLSDANEEIVDDLFVSPDDHVSKAVMEFFKTTVTENVFKSWIEQIKTEENTEKQMSPR